MATPEENEDDSRWPKVVLVLLGAIAGIAAAAIAWGRATPEPEPKPEPEPADASPEATFETVTLAGAEVPATWVQERPPFWVRPTVLWTIGVIVAVLAAFALLGILQKVVMWLVLALFFSFALEPAVNYLHDRRGWRRGAATGLLLAFTFLLILVIMFIFASALIQGAIAIAKNLPQWADQVSAWLSDTFGIHVSTNSISQTANDTASSLSGSDPVHVVLGASVSLIDGIFAMFTVGMFLFYMVAEGPKFKRAVLSMFPRQRQEELVSIWEAAIDKTGGYFYSKLVLMAINGGLFWVVLRLTDVPGAAPLALFQGFVAEFIPIVGTYIAAIVPLTFAFLSVGMPETLIILIYVLVYQQVENYLLAPRLQAKAMEVHPAVAFGAALAGGAIGGLLWAFLAIPFAATIQASASIWFQRHEVVESSFTQEQVTVVVKEERRRPSFGPRIGRFVRSSRGWLRRKEPAEPSEPTADGDATTATTDGDRSSADVS